MKQLTVSDLVEITQKVISGTEKPSTLRPVLLFLYELQANDKAQQNKTLGEIFRDLNELAAFVEGYQLQSD